MRQRLAGLSRSFERGMSPHLGVKYGATGFACGAPQLLKLKKFGDFAMYSWHGELVKLFNWDPLSFFTIPFGLTVKGVESKFEVSEGLFESADGPLHFDVHSHFLFDMVS
jgi:hypothetical protein